MQELMKNRQKLEKNKMKNRKALDNGKKEKAKLRQYDIENQERVTAVNTSSKEKVQKNLVVQEVNKNQRISKKAYQKFPRPRTFRLKTSIIQITDDHKLDHESFDQNFKSINDKISQQKKCLKCA